MPKRKQTKANTLPLFEQLADADQLRGFQNKDDREFVREKRRASKAKKHVPLARAPLTGPACLRCVFWSAPKGDDEFGYCRHLVKTLADAPWAGQPAGVIVERDTALKDWRVEHEPLRTGEAFRCSSYHEARDVEAA